MFLLYIFILSINLSLSDSVKCNRDQWKCNNNKECILISNKCNFINECSDNSDELKCPLPSCPIGTNIPFYCNISLLNVSSRTRYFEFWSSSNFTSCINHL